MVEAHAFNPSTQQEGRPLSLQDQPGLHNEFQASQGHKVKPCDKKTEKGRKEGGREREEKKRKFKVTLGNIPYISETEICLKKQQEKSLVCVNNGNQ